MPHRLSPVAYELNLSENPGVHWQVTRIHVTEALNQPYEAVIEAWTDAAQLDTDALLGCDACLSLTRTGGGSRALCGLVSRIDSLGDDPDHHLHVRFHVVPALELLRQRIDSRIWQQRSVRDIVGDVLDAALSAYGRRVDRLGIHRGGRARDYCVQYRESDFAFVSRLLEEEGISYEFVHDEASKRELLTLHDQNEQYEQLECIDGTAELPIITSNPGEADVESIQAFEWSKQLTSTAALRRDYDWHTPRHPLSAAASGVDDREHPRRIYAHGARRFITDDLDERAQDMQQTARLHERVAHGRSNVSAMRPGLRFGLRGHSRLDLEQEYLITEVVHAGSEAATAGTGDTNAAEGYANRFMCVPIDTTLRPRRVTPKPREYGPQTAIVTGPPGEEIHTDEHGRIQVQFHWQEHPSYAADSSCWIRCSQSWAGMGWGAQFIPRVGMEVVVEFLEGDPDRPLVTGCVYNTEHPPPFTLPDHKTQSGWRTESSPGGRGHNELRFEDAAGDEEIYLHGEKNWTIVIENDKDQLVGRNERLEVRNDRRKKVGHDERFEIANDQVGKVGHDQTLSVGHDQRVSVGADQSEAVGATKTVDVGASMTTSVGEDCSLTVERDASERVSGDKTVDAKTLTTTTEADTSFSSGKKFLVTAEDDIEVDGQSKVTVEAADKMVFKCGDASITLNSDGKILIKGSDVTVKGSGNVLIKGQKVAGN
jgi:type VI secretion system secreted protein VgrG